MKIVRFREKSSAAAHYGIVSGKTVKRMEGSLFRKLRAGRSAGTLDDVILLNPCVPGKIVALAANYRGATGVTEEMKEPIVFIKPSASACGPNDDIVFPFKNVRAWGESELGIVVGRRLRAATMAEARLAIFGYVCANDVTAENVEGRDHHLVRSKGADTFCPLGPWIDTEFDPSDAAIEACQNGTLIRRGNLKDRIWKDDQTLQWLSQWMTLDPGDVVLTGTPPRVVGKTFLSDGDIFEVRIDGLGSLKNRFVCRELV
jgi:2-keto-4-pentenoate hydratase/2-oxohepta-3-ene-1,7-dioic acid hydratase in catechol pathway